MRIIFAGSPDFSVPVLKSLHENHSVCLVITQPDRPSGRGKKLTACEVKQCALKLGLKVHQPESINNEHSRQLIREQNADIMIVAAYGQIIPLDILQMTKLHAWNIHASILPRWRGASPIEHAILHADKMTGISIMKMERGMDTGPVIHSETIEVGIMNRIQLTKALSQLAVPAILNGIDSIIENKNLSVQDDKEVTYAPKIKKDSFRIDWLLTAEQILCKILAFHPYCYFEYKGHTIRILDCEVVDINNVPGSVVVADQNKLIIAANQQAILIKELQLSGKKAISWKSFYNGHPDLFTVKDA
tara:strand:+ start:5505 stop:6413 length:909 start_codon:yes stop_codon:yes gene_type:complete